MSAAAAGALMTHRFLWTAGCGTLGIVFPRGHLWCVSGVGPCRSHTASPGDNQTKQKIDIRQFSQKVFFS